MEASPCCTAAAIDRPAHPRRCGPLTSSAHVRGLKNAAIANKVHEVWGTIHPPPAEADFDLALETGYCGTSLLGSVRFSTSLNCLSPSAGAKWQLRRHLPPGRA